MSDHINNLVTTLRLVTWNDVAGKIFWDEEGGWNMVGAK